MNIPYAQAKGLIKEADVLLFKANKFPGVGWWISKYTYSPYSHAGLAHWENGELYCLEFREFLGSRMYSMNKYVLGDRKKIDVFRAVETIVRPVIKLDGYCHTPYLAYEDHSFTNDVAEAITRDAKKLIGIKYSYWTIWQMLKAYIPFIRLGRKISKNGQPTKNFVCSTLVTYTYRMNFVDPVPFLSDGLTSPGDLARSGVFSKLFSINN